MESNADSCKTLIRERYSLAKEHKSQQLEYHRKKQKERKKIHNNKQSKRTNRNQQLELKKSTPICSNRWRLKSQSSW